MFLSQADPPTVDDEHLRGIMGEKVWLSHSPRSNLPAARSLLLKAHANKDWGLIATAWQAIYFIPGSIVECSSEGGAIYLVLYACQSGFLGWPCQERDDDDLGYIMPCMGKDPQCMWKQVKDLGDWQGHSTKVVGPMEVFWMLQEKRRSCTGIRLSSVGAPASILEFAARAGFSDIADLWLAKLINANAVVPRSGG